MKNDTRSTRGKALKIIAIAIGALAVMFLLSFVSTLSLKTNGMKEQKGEYITVYYETEETAAMDVFELANTESARIAKALGLDDAQDIRMYIYDRQSTFQTKKYGLIASFLNLDWYVGDNRGTDVLLTSPANPGPVHSYDENRAASIHEMVHAYNSIVNKNMPLWINEGIALYLTNGDSRRDLYITSYSVPSLEQTHTSNPVKFSNMGGYDFAHTYIEYLDKAYGWDRVVALARSSDYIETFDKDESEIYVEWIEFLKENYSG
ncbi:MAG: hypothetical protein AAGU74_09455 [Bacillota bacterium]